LIKGTDPLLNADVLQCLRAIGHGDDVVLCDTNFPAHRAGKVNQTSVRARCWS
jgi:L-fucose mutarotase